MKTVLTNDLIVTNFDFAEHISLGALGDSFYEYLLKAWIQNGQTESDVRQMFDDAMQALIKNIIVTSPSGLTYASDMKFDRLEHKMDHLACFAGNATSSFSIVTPFLVDAIYDIFQVVCLLWAL